MNGPAIWADFITLLKNAGFIVQCPHLPTCADSSNPPKTAHDDVALARKTLTELITAGHRVYVLMHSYGGHVGTEAMTPEMHFDPSNNSRGGVAKLIYLSAFMLNKTDSIYAAYQRHGSTTGGVELEVVDEGRRISIRNPQECLFNDLAASESERLLSELETHNAVSGTMTITNTPWRELPVLYVVCGRDVATDLGLQEMMVREAKEAGARQIETVSLEGAGHCAWIGHRKELLRVVEGAAA